MPVIFRGRDDRDPEPRGVPHPVFSEPPVIPGERCDKCPAAPRFRMAVPMAGGGQGELLFCTHHYKQLAPALAAAGLSRST